jgi:hypothetical protein
MELNRSASSNLGIGEGAWKYQVPLKYIKR